MFEVLLLAAALWKLPVQEAKSVLKTCEKVLFVSSLFSLVELDDDLDRVRFVCVCVCVVVVACVGFGSMGVEDVLFLICVIAMLTLDLICPARSLSCVSAFTILDYDRLTDCTYQK